MIDLFVRKKMKLINNKVILWGVSASPYVQKIMVALAEKGIVYELKETLPKVLLLALGQEVPSEFERISLLGKIPAIQVDDFFTSDSAVIAGYLDRKFSSGNALYPDEPQEYARSRWFEMYSDTVLTGVVYQKIFMEKVIKPKILNQASDDKIFEQAISNELPILLRFLDSSLLGNAWFAGKYFSMADVAVATQLLALETSGIALSQAQYPNLSGLMAKVLSRDSFNFLGMVKK